MIFQSVELQNFRNHAKTILNLGAGVNILVGDNAQGKTNIIEAIYMTCIGRGFRSPRDRDVIKFGESTAVIKTTAEKRYGKIDIEIMISAPPETTIKNTRGGSHPPAKQIKINGIPIAKMGELMGSLMCVFFNPDELKLVKETPADRRRFMDIDISQMDKGYFYNLLKYNRILKQRNALLKNISRTRDEMRSLDIWDEQLATVGESITARRVSFCEELRENVTKIHKNFAPTEILDIELECVGGETNTTHIGKSHLAVAQSATRVSQALANAPDTPTHPPTENCNASPNTRCGSHPLFLDALKKARERDLRMRTTTVGCHRDDLAISINGRDVRSFASQGQQRTVALSLKLAELAIFERVTGERPILLLDDVFSELDQSRREKLIELIAPYQSIITATEFALDHMPNQRDAQNPSRVAPAMFHVEHGAVTQND